MEEEPKKEKETEYPPLLGTLASVMLVLAIIVASWSWIYLIYTGRL